ncbi:response regulator [Paenibacillus sp. NFR01]|uniref:response regulator n=1 Tax=Paenibacillus sp. NFR01 TaxID=1566279 RepID=UPI0008C99118|nr:response regulator [Paenibacillus sp. NFR01]SEU20913.1 two-component system, response regulator YesN [Paenibacillus sp. NFR01]
MSYKVLLIDDEPSALEGLMLWLDWAALGFEVVGTCGNGREGLERIAELAPDLVITDVQMPVMNGLEMVAAWQKRRGAAPVKFAILSGYSEFEYAQTAIRYGINHYLLKPIFPEEAEEELREIYAELENERNRQLLNLIASQEEETAALKELLLGRNAEGERGILPAVLTGGAEQAWQVWLIACTPGLQAQAKTLAAASAAGRAALWIREPDGEGIVLVFAAPAQAGGWPELAAEFAELRRGAPEERLAVAAGLPARTPAELAIAYRTAREALQHFFYRPDAGLLDAFGLAAEAFSYRYDHLKLMDTMLGAVNTLETGVFRKAAADAGQGFRENRIAPEVVKKFAVHLFFQIIGLAPETERTALRERYAAPGVRHDLITLESLMRQLEACGEAVIALLTAEQDRRSQGVVNEINGYIAEHYRDSLTIQKLAEKFYLHPVYLGQLLLKKNGIHFHEQLHRLRIAEAEALLRGGKFKLSEVAERVGYANYSQFVKQFEKKNGMGPSEYRNAKT